MKFPEANTSPLWIFSPKQRSKCVLVGTDRTSGPGKVVLVESGEKSEAEMALIAAWKDVEEETPRNARNSGRTLGTSMNW